MTLEEETENALEVYEKEYLHSRATATRQMIEKHGYVGALSRLMKTPDLQSGFKVLRDNKALEYSFEQVILNHSEEFDRDIVAVAKWRLENADDLL